MMNDTYHSMTLDTTPDALLMHRALSNYREDLKRIAPSRHSDSWLRLDDTIQAVDKMIVVLERFLARKGVAEFSVKFTETN